MTDSNSWSTLLADTAKSWHGLALDASAPVVGDWDAARLDQVLANLVSNALKYSPIGSAVDIIVTREGDQLAFAVQDRGPGIKPEDAERIFEPFVRVGEAAAGSGGAGLGLAIAHRIVEDHGGEMHVQSEPYRGTRFTISLPVSEA